MMKCLVAFLHKTTFDERERERERKREREREADGK